MIRHLQYKQRLALAALSLSLLIPAMARAADPAGCAGAPSSNLDFWVGDWNIVAAGGGPSSTSKVSLDLDKCLVVERWDGGRGHIGENIFGYSADDRTWHGMFADNQGRVHLFLSGNVAAGSAAFTGPSRGQDGVTVLNRITIRRISDTRVQQTWEKSSDDGKTWSALFHLDYTRKR